jgi:cell wall-associated NlpC family hydrolase
METAAIAPATETDEHVRNRPREVAVHALALLGVNYKWGGNTPEDGLDCSGLVALVFQEVAGVDLPREAHAMSRVGRKIRKSQLQPGDLVFFNTRRRAYSHVGIYIGGSHFVHAPRHGHEVQVSSLRGSYWRNRYDGARRVIF